MLDEAENKSPRQAAQTIVYNEKNADYTVYTLV